MKRLVLTIISLLLLVAAMQAQEKTYTDVRQLYGVYYINDFQAFEKPEVPRGYSPVCISHYGRHGARYQDSEEAYTKVLDPLLEARKQGALTEYGENVCTIAEQYYALCKDHRGELTHVGWDQHRSIARLMYSAYPKLFTRKAEVTASTSFSQRCMMSMTAFCVGLKEVAPYLNVYAQTSRTLLDETNPGDKQNVNFVKTETLPYPWGLNYNQFYKTRVSHNEAMNILLRIFSSKEYVDAHISCMGYVQTLYNMIAGMHCTGDDLVIDDLFSETELFKFYEAINYGFFEWGALNKERFKPIVRSMVRMADEDLTADHPCVRLRFGHDTNLLGVLHMLDVEGLGVIPEDVNDLSKTWNCFMTPMAANFEFVLYKHKNNDDALVLPLLNGKIVRIGVLPETSRVGDLYKWDELKAFVDTL